MTVSQKGKVHKCIGTARVISSAGNGITDSFLESVEKAEKAKIQKAVGQSSQQEGTQTSGSSLSDFIAPRYALPALRMMVSHSTILPQCIRAYKDNIVGFGHTIEFWEGNNPNDTMKAEKAHFDEILEFFSLDMPMKKLLGKIIEDREGIGAGYMEVERDGSGMPVHGYYVDGDTIEVSKLGVQIQVELLRNGKTFTMYKRFRKFRQHVNAIGGAQTVYFKEFGDPRKMDMRTGKYLAEGETVEDQYEANEIIQFTVGHGAYGTVRWIGQSIHIEGSRLAENLNYNYFIKGRHTNLAMIVEGGTLTDDSFTNLQNYISDVEGVDNSHKMLLIEIDSLNDDSNNLLEDDGKKSKPTVKLEKLNDLLQSDALFQNYMDNSRKKVQSSFNLPDLYVGYTTDFNKATSESAVEVTERQVFGPERGDIDWTFNNTLFAPYGFKYVYYKLNGPTLSDQTYVIDTFKAASAAGGITPEDARKFAGKVFDIDLEPFNEDWSKIPLPIQQLIGTGTVTDPATGQTSQVVAVNADVIKSYTKADEFVAVLKEVKKELQRLKVGA